MPLCQICHAREASLFFTRIINGEKTELQVCRQCAATNGGIKLDVNNLLAGLSKLGMNTFEKAETQKVCEHCGMTLEEFNKTGLMGCSQCYSTFSEHVISLLGRVHGNIYHRGKRPGSEDTTWMADGQEHPEQSLEKLKAELQAAVMEEAYEHAAELRDRIRSLEQDKGVRT